MAENQTCNSKRPRRTSDHLNDSASTANVLLTSVISNSYPGDFIPIWHHGIIKHQSFPSKLLLLGRQERGRFQGVGKSEVAQSTNNKCLPNVSIISSSNIWSPTRRPSMIRIQRQPSSPPRGPISARPRASRPELSALAQATVHKCTHHQKHPTKMLLYRTDQCAEPGHRVYRMKKDIAPVGSQTSFCSPKRPHTIPGSRPPSAIPKRARTATNEA